MAFWIDTEGISKHYWTMKPGEEVTQPTYVGHFWRFVNSNTNQTLGGYCGVPEHIDVVITDEDVMAVEGNRQHLHNAIRRLNLWSTPSDPPGEDFRHSLAVDGNWISDESKNRLIWLPDEYMPTSSAINKNTFALGHASGRLTLLEINSKSLPLSSQSSSPQQL